MPYVLANMLLVFNRQGSIINGTIFVIHILSHEIIIYFMKRLICHYKIVHLLKNSKTKPDNMNFPVGGSSSFCCQL